MKPSYAELIVAQAEASFTFFHDPSNEPWAWDEKEAMRIGSEAFASRLAHDFYDSTGRAPQKATFTTAMAALAAKARWDGPEARVGLRVAEHEGQVVLDLADAEQRVVVIGPDGWSVTRDQPVRFQRPGGMGPLPVPTPGSDLGCLEGLWPVDGDDLVLILGWLVGCFNPSGSKPVLDLSGTQGSGKSMLARMLSSLFDPNAVALQTMPSDVRNLAIVAARHALFSFDNASTISNEISDALCRLATGGGFETRKLYTDDEVATFIATRPVLITGIPQVAEQADLVDRTIAIVLPGFRSGARRTEAELLSAFEQVRPGLLGLLCSAVACALANRDETSVVGAPRMLDFATWVEASAPALGWEPGRFARAFSANRREGSARVVDSSLVGQFVATLAAEGFIGTPHEVLRRLGHLAGTDTVRRRGWPTTPHELVDALRRLEPALADVGVEIDITGSQRGTRSIRFGRADWSPSQAPGVVSLFPSSEKGAVNEHP